MRVGEAEEDVVVVGVGGDGADDLAAGSGDVGASNADDAVAEDGKNILVDGGVPTDDGAVVERRSGSSRNGCDWRDSVVVAIHSDV